ncbi:MAG: 3D-(3,5/4)-trihydroxycyclohexane-1,2-dione acylhydrolase (decyclizing) [Proteobacteria bacterium]|nr:3D-(3,5/4)-trihydroxycyclohexane-1,2-dione acylhydrolase (decyclizing) [Pseudomonadota bacterium]
MTRHLTVAQATVAFLSQQYVERDGEEVRYFGGCLGIFGHGNVAGLGQALEQDASLRYYLFRNEQAMVHAASAFAKATFRRRALVCTTSVGPGATNMVTGAALASINRLPVLLLPGDIFASRQVAPVLQQLESSQTPDISVNDCFKPLSRYWDRIQRPEQLLTSLPEAMRVLTSPVETGAVTVCMPQDVQAEAFDFPEEFFRKRVWRIPRNRCDAGDLQQAAEWIQASRLPMIIAGGGVLYSEASAALAAFAASTGIPVGETQAGKGSLPFDHAQLAGAVGATGTSAANILAREADLIIGVGTRYSDFTTASKTAFQNPRVRFVNINVCELDAYKHAAVALTGDARVTLDELRRLVGGYRIDAQYCARIAGLQQDWNREVERLYGIVREPMAQSQFIRVLNEFTQPADIIVNAAGSLPGDLHKLWRTRQPGGYHMEYGYSCMGYEIAGGLGIKMAHPQREVYVLVGDGSYLMMAQEIVTSVQEGYKLNIVLLDNHGFSSIGGLSRSCGNEGMGTEYRYRRDGKYSGEALPVDFQANAASLGAWTTRVNRIEDLKAALQSAREQPRTSVVVIETSYTERVPGYESWWDVPIAEVSESTSVQSARTAYEAARKKQRYFF